MRYFTPDLYEALSRHGTDAEMNAVEDRWEQAILDYDRRLAEVRSELSGSAYDLPAISMHDATVLFVGTEGADVRIDLAPELSGDTTILYRQASMTTDRRSGHPFNDKWPLWLYDEVDREGERNVHRIMISDGRVIRIEFADVTVTPRQVIP